MDSDVQRMLSKVLRNGAAMSEEPFLHFNTPLFTVLTLLSLLQEQSKGCLTL